MRCTRTVIPAALVAACLLAPAGAAAQEPVVATLDRETAIAAHRGVLAFSQRDPASDRFRLMLRSGGVTTPAAIAPRAVPFDVDLGPTATGSIAAVYSRCAREVGGSSAEPLYGRGRDCDLYRYDLDTGVERRLADASSPAGNEFWPTIWRDRIAFARTYDTKPDYPYLYTRPAEGGGRSQRLPGGQRKECFRDRRTGRLQCSDDTLSRPIALDLYGRRLGFAWAFSGLAEGLDTEIRIDTVGGGHERVAAQNGGGLTSVRLGWPAFAAGRLYFSQECSGDPSGCNGRFGLRRYRYTTGDLDRAPGPRAIISHERDGATTYVLVDTASGTSCQGDPAVPGGTCELRALQPVFG
jgi:hypothetical protein